RHMLRGIAEKRQLAGLEDLVAVVHRRNHEMMQVGGKNQRDPKQAEEISNQHTLLVLGWINCRDKTETELLRDDRSRHLKRRDREPRRQAEHRPDNEFLEQENKDRSEGRKIDSIGLLMGW